ncbi:hypothetical protein [uncultured Draconibacterium sp.]|uniref:hypothetical protein n=1 Tax=uncultured Draconibacterium sp. TaxID=1573823 RepID=UPI0029C6F91F|nr:hypothetical protein [uncultured Draconibacterium sp.]
MNTTSSIKTSEKRVRIPIPGNLKPMAHANHTQALIDNINKELNSKLEIGYKAWKEDGSRIEKGDEFNLDIIISVDDNHYKNLAFENLRVTFASDNKFATLLNPTRTKFFRCIEKEFNRITGSSPARVQARLLATGAIYPENVSDIVENMGMLVVEADPIIQSLFHIHRVMSDIPVEIQPAH